MRRIAPNSYWARYRDVGIRSFPRAGSTSITETYGRGNNLANFLAAPHRVVVVRCPWDRMMSVFYGVACSSYFKSYAIKKTKDINYFVEWMMEQDPYKCDAHITPYWAFLEEYFQPLDSELMTMRDFFKAPPFGLPHISVHKNETSYPQEIGGVKVGVMRRWADWAMRDIILYTRAQKSPLITRGQAGDGRRT